MSTTTDSIRLLTPQDAGAALSHEEFEHAHWAPGHRYELVAGTLHVNPAPDPAHAFLQDALLDHLKAYSRARRDVLGLVVAMSRVVTDGLGGPTNVEPDIAAYAVKSRKAWIGAPSWRDLSPLVVVEVLGSNPKKDLVRNVEVYRAVPSIQEYWIVDPRRELMRPTLVAYVRGLPRGRGPAGSSSDGWTERRAGPGAAYRTDLLPGLEVDLAALLRS